MMSTRHDVNEPNAQAAMLRPFALLVGLLVVWFGLLALFALNPALDLNAANAFFSPGACEAGQAPGTICGTFPFAESRALVVLRYSLYYLPHLFGIILLFLVIRHRRNPEWSAFNRRGWIFLAGLIAGPLLLVNGILKQVSHRPRPYQTDLFGGSFDFAAAGDFTGACIKNCSFISGEASGMGWVICLGLLAAPRTGWIIWPILAVACLTGAALRVGFGGHYLSDAVLGFLSSPVILVFMAVLIGWPARMRN